MTYQSKLEQERQHLLSFIPTFLLLQPPRSLSLKHHIRLLQSGILDNQPSEHQSQMTYGKMSLGEAII